MNTPANCTDSELSTYLQGLGEGYLPTYYSDTNPSVPSKLNPIASKSYTLGKKTVCFLGFPSLTMSKHLTESRGEDLLRSSQADSLAKTFPVQEKAQESAEKEADYGQKWQEWFAKFDHATSSWKTPQCSLLEGLDEFWETWPRWGMMQDGECWALSTPERLTKENGYGFWPTPVKTDGFAVGWCLTSIERKEQGQPRPSGAHIGSGLKYFRKTGKYLSNGYPNPALTEWLMGWPASWTDLQPLATDKFQQWLRSHGEHSAKE